MTRSALRPAPLVAYCEVDENKVQGEWVCPADPLTVECEDGVGDPEKIFFVPEIARPR